MCGRKHLPRADTNNSTGHNPPNTPGQLASQKRSVATENPELHSAGHVASITGVSLSGHLDAFRQPTTSGSSTEDPNTMEFKFVPEPYLSEVVNYIRQRREHIQFYLTMADVKQELLRNITEYQQPVDMYPKGRAFVNDEEYLSILKDMFNLSNVLDDMEQTGWIPYHTRGHYYNVYGRLYRMLSAKAKQAG